MSKSAAASWEWRKRVSKKGGVCRHDENHDGDDMIRAARNLTRRLHELEPGRVLKMRKTSICTKDTFPAVQRTRVPG